MAQTVYDLTDPVQVMLLWHRLVSFGFEENLDLEDEEVDATTVLGVLSDIDWYREVWEPGTVSDLRHTTGFHPVAGEEDEWDTYMTREGSVLTLVEP